jgi:hypothetical protein
MLSMKGFSNEITPLSRRLQTLGLPGSITALERPVGLPPSLLKKAEEVFVAGGLQKLQYLINEIKQHSQNNANLLDRVSFAPATPRSELL